MSSFKLHSDDSEFNNRVDALFSTLQTAAVDLQPQSKRTFEDLGEDEGGESFGRIGGLRGQKFRKATAGEDEGEESISRIGGQREPMARVPDDTAEEDEDGESFVRIGGPRLQKFRRPEGFAPKWRGRGGSPRNSTPDYVKNPQNWTRYSMKDTKVLSDGENKQVGLQLFGELRDRRLEEEREKTEGGEISNCSKIVFKKPIKDNNKELESEESIVETDTTADALFGGTKKFKMEEYAVGQSKPKSKKKAKPNILENEIVKDKKKDSVKLNYLMFEEEENDD